MNPTNNITFSSNTDDWETPDAFFQALDGEFHFVLDAAANSKNAKCDRYYSKEQDGLSKTWQFGGAVWCNPPYGRNIYKWVQKASYEAKKGTTVVMLLPASTDTKWFHEMIYTKAEVRFVQGRLKFKSDGKEKDRATFPSMIVVFR